MEPRHVQLEDRVSQASFRARTEFIVRMDQTGLRRKLVQNSGNDAYYSSRERIKKAGESISSDYVLKIRCSRNSGCINAYAVLPIQKSLRYVCGRYVILEKIQMDRTNVESAVNRSRQWLNASPWTENSIASAAKDGEKKIDGERERERDKEWGTF